MIANNCTTLDMKLLNLLSKTATLEELTEYLQTCYETNRTEGLNRLKGHYKAPHKGLIGALIEALDDKEYINARTLFNTLFFGAKTDPYEVYQLIKGLQPPYTIDEDLADEENIHIFAEILSRDICDFVFNNYEDMPRYVTKDFLEYCTYKYLRNTFTFKLTDTVEINYES